MDDIGMSYIPEAEETPSQEPAPAQELPLPEAEPTVAEPEPIIPPTVYDDFAADTPTDDLGAPAFAPPVPPQAPLNPPQYGGMFYEAPPQKPKKSKAPLIICIVLALCMIIAGVAIIAGLRGNTNNDADDNTLPFSQDDSDSQDDADTGEDVELHDSEEVATLDKNGNYTVAGVAEKCMDSCVGIEVYTNQSVDNFGFYGYYGNNELTNEPTLAGEGSGIIMKEAGGKTYIITCAHVISGGDSFKVILNDQTELDAYMVAYDSQTDIGVLYVEETGLQIAEFANSENLVVGEQVVAIGCPGGLEFMNSVASGYVSALSRPISSSIGYDNECIQTDTAINPGNSGGGLFNMQGQVVGINSSKIASTEYEGMGFAVPSSTAIQTANSLIANGYVSGRAKIGISYNQLTSYSNATAILAELEKKGFKGAEGTMVIQEIDAESDLNNADIKQNDMIIAVNDETLTSIDVMTSALSELTPGDTVKLTIARIENNSITTFDIECKTIEDKG